MMRIILVLLVFLFIPQILCAIGKNPSDDFTLLNVTDECIAEESPASIHQFSSDGVKYWFAPVSYGIIGMATCGSWCAFFGIVLGLIDYDKNISESFSAPVRTGGSLYETFSKFIPKEQLDSHIKMHVSAKIICQLFTQILSIKLIGYRENMRGGFMALGEPNGAMWRDYKQNILIVILWTVPYAIGQAASGAADYYFNKKLHVVLEDNIKSELFNGETILRLSHDPNGIVLMDSFKNDISNVVNAGNGLVAGVIASSIRGGYGVVMIMIHSPATFVSSVAIYELQSFISNYLLGQQRAYNEKINVLNSKFTTTFKHDVANINTIIERDGVDATEEKIEQIMSDLRDLDSDQRNYVAFNRLFWALSVAIEQAISYYFLGREIDHGGLPLANGVRIKARSAAGMASGLLFWIGGQAQEMSYIKESMDRIAELGNKMRALPSSVDQIKREVQKGGQLIFQDLVVGVGGRTLVMVDDLRLNMGKVYAITGETGSGKTSLLSKIKGVKENGIFGKGSIYYPEIDGKDPKIIMLSQDDYFPLDASLYEIISYPDKDPNDPVLIAKKRKKVELLLQEIGLHAFNDGALNLNSKEDWYTYLSGGEKKKVTIVSAMLKNPDILILDEIFNGLDLESKIKIQQMLKKYLSNTLILSVDHNAYDNNRAYIGKSGDKVFYNSELHLHDKNIIVRG